MRRLIKIAAMIVIMVAWTGLSAVAADTRATDFSLIDHHGRAVTQADYRGQFMILFFGYTYCPDVCPTELSMIAQALDTLSEQVGGKLAGQVTPIFISVDPERDTVEALAAYVSVFHDRLVGLTGSKEQIIAVAKNYGARYYKAYAMPFANGADDGGENTDYLISHSAASYLVGPEGTLLQVFAYGTAPDDMAAGIAAHLK